MAEHEVRGLTLDEIDELTDNYAKELLPKEYTQGTQLSANVNEENEFVLYEQQSLEI
jgi:DNA recombination-dependent growth factor C